MLMEIMASRSTHSLQILVLWPVPTRFSMFLSGDITILPRTDYQSMQRIGMFVFRLKPRASIAFHNSDGDT